MAYSWLVSRTALLWLLASLLVVTGCPKTKRRLVVPDAPTTGDKTARVRFQHARSLFKRDNVKAAAEFEKIVRQYPNDPIAPWAMLYAGIAAYRAGDHAKAVVSLTKLMRRPTLDAKLRSRGNLFFGLALNYQGKHALALAQLRKLEENRRDFRGMSRRKSSSG